MVHDSVVRRVLDGLLGPESLQVRQMTCRDHMLRITIVRMSEPPYAAHVHGCGCAAGLQVERAVQENVWERYPDKLEEKR